MKISLMFLSSSVTFLGLLTACATPGTLSVPAEKALIRSDYAEGQVTQHCQKSINDARRSLDQIGGVAAQDRRPENTLLALDRTLSDFSDQTAPLTFMGYVSTHPQLSAEGSACEGKVNQFGVEVFSRRDLYNAIHGLQKLKTLGVEQRRLLSQTLRAFEMNGLKLPDDQLTRVRELKTQLAALEADFAANINADATTVEFSASELDGVSHDFLARLKKAESGKYLITTKSTDYTQVMENAKSGETRRKMLLVYFNRAAGKNVAVLEKAILLRQKIAAAMGFKTWADYRTQNHMAKGSRVVLGFLNGLKGKLAVSNRKDLSRLLAFKKTITSDPGELKLWDISYLSYQLKKRDFDLDDDKIREFFPADVVIQGMFNAYSRLLGVQFVEVREAAVWAEGVKLYRVENTSDRALIGFFFADFIPRQGKYGHAAAFSLISGRKLADGAYSHPISAIVANMNPPANGKPSLLNHSEVETLFHEFGHIMHQTLTRAPFGTLSGSNVAQDFVEAPSQMLENWVWSPEVLSSLSGHYQDHSRKLPKELLSRMIAARDFNQGYFYTRQLMLGLLDMAYHTASGPVDTTAIQNRLYREIIGVEPIEGGHFQAGFGHLMGGYDSGYYGYLWSKVYAEDMFTRFESAGLFDSGMGMRYRHTILEKGDMLEAMDLLNEFLGRAPSNQAFLKKLHINI
ncbi:M3 family metallopeptidase [Bdellovibrionota bacterium FG-1]